MYHQNFLVGSLSSYNTHCVRQHSEDAKKPGAAPGYKVSDHFQFTFIKSGWVPALT